jgi:hypothetical protein
MSSSFGQLEKTSFGEIELLQNGVLTIDPSDRTVRLREFCDKHDINTMFMDHLDRLADYEVVIVADDSGSMATSSKVGAIRTTRWQELCRIVSILVELSVIFDSNGVDIHFLNRPALLGVKHSDEIHQAFVSPPCGGTPIVPVLEHIFSTPSRLRKLVFLATDGEPTSPDGRSDIFNFHQTLIRRDADQFRMTILACTDDKRTMRYLNGWDTQIPYFDVIDDYESERAEIRKFQGSKFHFTFGDYVVKALMGTIDPWFDHLDEKNIYRLPSTSMDRGCCTIL